MSAANLASVTFGDVYNDASDATDDETIRESILGMERLAALPDSEKDTPLPKPHTSYSPLAVPKLEGNQRSRPLALVELPIDVLKDIVKEVSTPRRGRWLVGWLRSRWATMMLAVLMMLAMKTILGHPYQRSHKPLPHLSLPPFPRDPPDLLTF